MALLTNSRKKKITVRFSKNLRNALHTAVITGGYGLRGKSMWMQEAIFEFLQQANYVECVEHGVTINQSELTEIEAFYVTVETLHALKNALFAVRVRFPLLEGVQSAFLRACVVYRVMLN